MKILIIDDYESLCIGLQGQLEMITEKYKNDYTIEYTTDIDNISSTIEQYKPHLIFLDFCFPDKRNANDILKENHKFFVENETRIICMSGLASGKELRVPDNEHVLGFHLKPIHENTLETIMNLFEEMMLVKKELKKSKINVDK